MTQPVIDVVLDRANGTFAPRVDPFRRIALVLVAFWVLLGSDCRSREPPTTDSRRGFEISPKSVLPIPETTRSILFADGGNLLLTWGFDDPIIRVWDVETGKELRRLDEHPGDLALVAPSEDGKIIASVERSVHDPGTVRLWDVATGRVTSRYSLADLRATPIGLSPDLDTLLLYGFGREGPDVPLFVRDLKKSRRFTTLRGHKSYVFGAIFSRNGSRLVTVDSKANASVWETKTWKSVCSVRLLDAAQHEFLGGSIAVSGDGKILAAGSSTNGHDPRIYLWDVEKGEKLRELSGHDGGRKTVFSPHGGLTTIHYTEVIDLAFSPDGSYLASVGIDDRLKVWEVATGTRILEREEQDPIAVAFSPDGKHLAVATRKLVEILEVRFPSSPPARGDEETRPPK